MEWRKSTKERESGIPLEAVMEEVVAGGITRRGAWSRLKLTIELPFFAITEEKMDDVMENLESGDKLRVWIAERGGKPRIIKIEKLGGEEKSGSHEKEHTDFSSPFVLLARCPNCGEEMVWIKNEIAEVIERIQKGFRKFETLLKLKEK